jgi:hypothetical protein
MEGNAGIRRRLAQEIEEVGVCETRFAQHREELVGEKERAVANDDRARSALEDRGVGRARANREAGELQRVNAFGSGNGDQREHDEVSLSQVRYPAVALRMYSKAHRGAGAFLNHATGYVASCPMNNLWRNACWHAVGGAAPAASFERRGTP